jgi:hypothetical protein
MPASDVTIMIRGMSADYGVPAATTSRRPTSSYRNGAFALLDPSGHRPEPLFQMPPVSMLVFKLAAVSLGIARSALDEVTQLAQAKTPSLYTDVLADRPAAIRSGRSRLGSFSL